MNVPVNAPISKRVMSTRKQLEQLELLREVFGVRAVSEKLTLLASLEHKSLSRSSEVERLHEMLCFMRAWPDSPKLLATVNRMLRNFDAREDLQRFAGKLANTGIAGTDIRFRFYFVTARWLASRWADALRIDWDQFDAQDQLASQLRCLTLFGERGALEQFDYDVHEWIDEMRGNGETDAEFLINRYSALAGKRWFARKYFRCARSRFSLVAIYNHAGTDPRVSAAEDHSVSKTKHQPQRHRSTASGEHATSFRSSSRQSGETTCGSRQERNGLAAT